MINFNIGQMEFYIKYYIYFRKYFYKKIILYQLLLVKNLEIKLF